METISFTQRVQCNVGQCGLVGWNHTFVAKERQLTIPNRGAAIIFLFLQRYYTYVLQRYYTYVQSSIMLECFDK